MNAWQKAFKKGRVDHTWGPAEEIALGHVLRNIKNNDQYVIGWRVIFSNHLACVNPESTDKLIHRFHPVTQNDVAHMHSETKGSLFVTLLQDANFHVAPVCYTCILDNEGESTWIRHLKYIKEHLPTFCSDPYLRGIADGVGGFDTAFADVHSADNPTAQSFLCSKHRAITVTEQKPARETKALYKKLLKAPKETTINRLLGEATPAVRHYLSKTPSSR